MATSIKFPGSLANFSRCELGFRNSTWREQHRYSCGPLHTFRIEKFENAALFLRLGLPSTLIRHENGPFWKRTLLLPEDFETCPCSRFSEDRRHCENNDARLSSLCFLVFLFLADQIFYRFYVNRQHFPLRSFASLCRAFLNNDDVMIITWFPWPSFPQTQMQSVQLIAEFLNFSGVVWTKNIPWVFRVKTPFSNFSDVVWTGPKFLQN